ncbi:hypothetical protein [Albimonas donghaensis]|uniref:hypothetical protein n=1 Tax=Albimonas donghaensis TaxID=356660 RepID=UPI0015A13490|nr:hypothetical protein [Albimonas donghaensis]
MAPFTEISIAVADCSIYDGLYINNILLRYLEEAEPIPSKLVTNSSPMIGLHMDKSTMMGTYPEVSLKINTLRDVETSINSDRRKIVAEIEILRSLQGSIE